MLRNIFKAGIGGVASQVVTISSLPVIARLYDPSDYAGWVMLMAAVWIIGRLVTFRYELAILLPKNRADASSLFWLCVGSTVAISALAALALLVPAVRGLATGQMEGTAEAVWVIPYLVLCLGLIMTLRHWNIRCERYLTLSVAQVSLVTFTCGGQILYGWLEQPTVSGLMIGSAVGHTVAVVILLVGVLSATAPMRLDKVASRIPELARIHRRFLLYATPYSVFGVLRERGVIYLLESYVTATRVGFYAFAYRVLRMPVGLISGGIQPVVFREAATKGMAAVEDRVNGLLRWLALLTTPFVVLFVFYHERLFIIAFGAKWAEAADLGVIIIWASYTILFCVWMDRLYDVMGLQRLTLILEATFSTLSLAAMWLGLEFGLSLEGALIAQASVLVIYNVTFTVVVYRRAGWALRPLLGILQLAAAVALGSVVILMVLDLALPPMWSLGSFAALLAAGGAITGPRLVRRLRK